MIYYSDPFSIHTDKRIFVLCHENERVFIPNLTLIKCFNRDPFFYTQIFNYVSDIQKIYSILP